jgi:hypothetical protein
MSSNEHPSVDELEAAVLDEIVHTFTWDDERRHTSSCRGCIVDAGVAALAARAREYEEALREIAEWKLTTRTNGDYRDSFTVCRDIARAVLGKDDFDPRDDAWALHDEGVR